ncbi:redoxin domain-containing protein [Mesoaciditoga lauensis]|uniref:redoxin domain-containing protein n=1 Tax=Mesoaciditoga lauensis TaxID=1495039 RepID=UPI00055AD2EC|nr:peroxiredoxin [Mesoaciditoga lauensis]
MLKVGETAPQFKLYDTDLNLVFLKDFAGKKVVLAFYPGAFTAVCQKEMCTLNRAMSKFEKLNAQVIGISVDGPFANRAFKIQNEISFPILCDFNREVVNMYDVAEENFYAIDGYTAARRSVFILDREGKIAYMWLSKNAGQEPDYEEIERELEKIK